MTRLLSLVALVCVWQIAAHFANPRLLPGPMAVLTTMRSEAASGALFAALGVTLARVAAAFLLAMAVGSAIGYAMGRNALHHRACVYLGRSQRSGGDRRGGAQQTARHRRDHTRGRARARHKARRNGACV